MPIYNFSAGPAMLPKEVLEQAQKEFLTIEDSQMSIVELSHRSVLFEEILQTAQQLLRELMEIPENYQILLLQGGASLQFSMVPLNLARGKKVLYVNSGAWAQKAIAAAQAIADVAVEIVATSEADHFLALPEIPVAQLDQTAAYLHLTTNETIGGISYQKIPQVGTIPIVADMSSNILANDYRVTDFGLIYAGAQKNMGIAGLTVVIIREDLLANEPVFAPLLDYKVQAQNDSMYNTPPTFAIYMAKLVFEWVQKQGGVAAMYQKAQEKAALLYDYLDQSQLFSSPVKKADRSLTNIPFVTGDPDLDKQFITAAQAAGLENLKGHRSVGGMRASFYNAMPEAGVRALLAFMRKFEEDH